MCYPFPTFDISRRLNLHYCRLLVLNILCIWVAAVIDPIDILENSILASIDAEGVGFKRLCRLIAVEFLKCSNYRAYRIST